MYQIGVIIGVVAVAIYFIVRFMRGIVGGIGIAPVLVIVGAVLLLTRLAKKGRPGVIGIAIALAFNVFGWFTIFNVVRYGVNPLARISRTKTPVAVEQVVKRTIATVTSDALNMRAQPSAEGTLVLTLKKGDRLTVTGTSQDGWLPVESGGKSGFVRDTYVSIKEE